jgi:hypothetical protein
MILAPCLESSVANALPIVPEAPVIAMLLFLSDKAEPKTLLNKCNRTTALCVQPQTNKIIESVTNHHFQ